jgi:hypothetical protein
MLAEPAHSQTTNNCLLPEAFNPYFQAALDEIETRIGVDVVEALDAIGLAPLGNSLSISNILDFTTQVFEPLFGTAIERNVWINVTSDIDVLQKLTSNLNKIAGATNPTFSATCQLEATNDLEGGELPYRFGMEFALAGTLVPTDFDLGAMSPSIAVLPEETFPKLELNLETLTAEYELKMPLTIDTKRKKFMVGEIQIGFTAGFESSVLQLIPLTETVSQNFTGTLEMNAEFLYSSIHDWSYTGSYEARLTAQTSVGTQTANLGLIAFDEDVFDDKPREFVKLHILFLVT